MKSHLEHICHRVDDVLAKHGIPAKVAGGYIANTGLLLSLSDTTFINTAVRWDIKQALKANQVLATVGVVMVSNVALVPDDSQLEPDVIEGEFEVSIAPPVTTVDILDLIVAHEVWGESRGGDNRLPSNSH
jgi:hypothetical protein